MVIINMITEDAIRPINKADVSSSSIICSSKVTSCSGGLELQEEEFLGQRQVVVGPLEPLRGTQRWEQAVNLELQGELCLAWAREW